MWASILSSNGFARWRWVYNTVSDIILGSINGAERLDELLFPLIQTVYCNKRFDSGWSEPPEADALYFQDGSWCDNLSSYFNMNTFLDTILTCVLQKGGKRRIVFSCFDPDICTMWVSLATEENERLRRLRGVQEHSDLTWQCSCWVTKMDDSELTRCWHGFLRFSSGCAVSRTNTPSSSSLRESQTCILS